MTYVVLIDPGTDKCRDFFNYLSAQPNSRSREWPNNVGLTEAINAGAEDEDYNWYIDDIQNAKSIQRVDGLDGDRNTRFKIEFERISQGTTAVIEALMRKNNRLGHAHINSATYLTKEGKQIPISRDREPTTFDAD